MVMGEATILGRAEANVCLHLCGAVGLGTDGACLALVQLDAHGRRDYANIVQET